MRFSKMTRAKAKSSGWFQYGTNHRILLFNNLRAEDEARTRDLKLGKLALYQLSYFRLYIILKYNN